MILHGDCVSQLKELDSNSIDSLVTDPPAGIAFMQKKWDSDRGGRDQWIEWMAGVMKECLRVLKPGAHGFVWALPRTSHWTATALENAGFEIRDVVTHLFGSGFPKSHNISKGIDKKFGLKGKDLGPNPNRIGRTQDIRGGGLSPAVSMGLGKKTDAEKLTRITELVSDQAKQYDGWGTALKPASEHWILVRKPLSEKTIVDNVLKHGTGGINIDASRVGTETIKTSAKKQMYGTGTSNNGKPYKIDNRNIPDSYHQGRFPANLVLSHTIWCKLNGVKDVKISTLLTRHKIKESENKAMSGKNYARSPKSDYGTNGTETVENWDCHESCAISMLDKQVGECKSIFFYCAKPSKREKNAGLEGMPKKQNNAHDNPSRMCGSSGKKSRTEGMDRSGVGGQQNHHPTVKSIKLMSYLITMITPQGGTVLDPFMGSGSTGCAAKDFNFIGIEKELEYFKIAEARINGQESSLCL